MKRDGFSLRQAQLMRETSRVLLWEFLSCVVGYVPEAQAKHFREEFRRLRPWAHIGRKSLVGTSEDRRCVEAFFRILEATARGKVPVDADLDSLKDGLNRPIHGLSFQPGPSERRQGPGAILRAFKSQRQGPYTPSSQDAIRAASQLLWDYINTTYKCGPVHMVCSIQDCGSLMTEGRGGKKFCSPECRKAYWSYSKHREYFLKKQQKNRRIREGHNKKKRPH